MLDSNPQSWAAGDCCSSSSLELREQNPKMPALERVTSISPSQKKCIDDVKNNFLENTVRRNLQALNKLKL